MKRDMERRIFDLQTSVEEVDRGAERKLKKELRKYRMLYKDAKKASETQVLYFFEVFIILLDLVFKSFESFCLPETTPLF